MEVFFGGGGDDMIMVGHEDDMMDENVIFFMGFPECIEHDASGVPFIESEGLVISPTDQVVG
jgi:hypothetical protein